MFCKGSTKTPSLLKLGGTGGTCCGDNWPPTSDTKQTGDVQIENAVEKKKHILAVMARHELPADDLITFYTTLAMSGIQLLMGCNATEIIK